MQIGEQILVFLQWKYRLLMYILVQLIAFEYIRLYVQLVRVCMYLVSIGTEIEVYDVLFLASYASYLGIEYFVTPSICWQSSQLDCVNMTWISFYFSFWIARGCIRWITVLTYITNFIVFTPLTSGIWNMCFTVLYALYDVSSYP